MLSKEEYKAHNFKFWNDFQALMRKEKSSNGKKINWLNYPSDVKNVFIRLEADTKSTKLCVDIQPKDDSIRSIIYEQMTELQNIMEIICEEKAIWEEHYQNNNNQTISRIYWELKNVNFIKNEDIPLIYDFLRERLIKFDEFYQEFKEILIALVN